MKLKGIRLSCAVFCVAIGFGLGGRIAGADNTPFGVNDAGLISGTLTIGAQNQGYVFDTFTSTYTIINIPGASSTQVIGINNSDQIVGDYVTSAGSFGFVLNRSSFLSSGAFTTINVSGAGPSGTAALGINSFGDISGAWTNGSNVTKGFLYQNGSFINTAISNSPSFTNLFGINDVGMASGYTAEPVNVRQGFTYDIATGTFTPLTFPGSIRTIAQGINNAGEVVGIYTLPDNSQWGFTYSLANGYQSFAFPGSTSTQLYGINNLGEVVGTYTCSSCPSNDPAFFAVPTADGYAFTTMPSPTPEPASAILFASGLLAPLVAYLRLRSKKPIAAFSGRCKSAQAEA